MSRIAIISDIHSNWQALQEVWQAISSRNCDEVICLGDVVGYGARPADCFRFIVEKGWTWIQGNHDALIGDKSLSLNFNPASLLAVEHNRRLLDAQQLEHLRNLPWRLHPAAGLYLAHGSYQDRDRYLIYRADFREEAAYLLEQGGPGLCFFGHTHHPVVFAGDNFLPLDGGRVPVQPEGIMLVNPGSVGQPRDGDPRAAFAIWDQEAGELIFERVAYDVDAAREEILAAGLPERLGNRLLMGR